MCSASAPTASPAARDTTPTSAPGSSFERGRARGFTLVELLVVLALVAIGAAVVTLALRDPALTQLEREAARLSALLEAARAESRAAGVAARWELGSGGDPDSAFRFVGLPPKVEFPHRWLDRDVVAEIVGARAVLLGPEPLIGAQRIVLRLGEQRIDIGTDGLAPFAVLQPPPT